ncbi:tRNA (uracil-5-)-methyltransferase [Nematocida displodere]|uniref:tRNA (Uracil-5-)-methyltransferase n=1 Tax=Nematocida displodere TaxID=1805483 RepID=A0A177EFH1_9MICR|nr:tRNA (uracil-5-)-methyltransferase [Nematocida displodere]
MANETYTWKAHNIKKAVKRQEFLQSVEKCLGTKEFSLAYKDNNRTAILITKMDTLPPIIVKSQELTLKRKDSERKEVKDIVTPLNHLSYDEQLASKVASVEKFAAKLGCASIEIVKSPQETGYRNKCEFTFGFEDGKPALGFRPGKYTDAPNNVANPSGCAFNTGAEMLGIVARINQHISTTTDLVYDRISQTGHLRVLLIRRIGQALIGVLQVNVSSNEEAVKVPEILAFIEFLPIEHVYVESNCTTFEGFRTTSVLHKVKGPETEYTETLNNSTFRVSPMGFFQINIPVAEIMCQTIQKEITTSTILDICCGAGLLGISTAKGTSNAVIGIEISPDAVKDAQENARVNQIKAKYYCGSVEQIIDSGIKEIQTGCTALLDPPRAGLSLKLIKKITDTPSISEIFYISCSYTQAKESIEEITKGGFKLERVHVLDMFPFTPAVECIFHYKRAEN